MFLHDAAAASADHLSKAASSAVIWPPMLSFASALIEAGVKSGDSVIVMSENRVEWLVCDFGIQAAGAVTVPIYPNTPPEVARTIAEDSLAVLAIASDSQLAAKLPAGGSLRQVVLMDREVRAWTDGGPTRLAEVDARLRAIRPDDMCTVWPLKHSVCPCE